MLKRSGFALLLTLMAALSPTASATASTWGSNTGARGAVSLPALDGIAGFQNLTPMVPAQGFAIAHPAQMAGGTPNSDFLGFGTTKGVGVSSCPDDYSSGWEVYSDGISNNTYFCKKHLEIAGNAQSQSFIVKYELCAAPGNLYYSWDLYWQGTLLQCYVLSFQKTTSEAAGSENLGSNPGQSLAVSFVQMQSRVPGDSFRYWTGWIGDWDSPYKLTALYGRTDSFSVTP